MFVSAAMLPGMDARAFLDRIQASRHYRGQIAAARYLPPRPARFAAPQTGLPDALRALLEQERIAQFYSHQAECYDAVRSGENAVVSTGTASGKSLCFHLPVLAELVEHPASRALYLFPAKALAYDQLGHLERMVTRAGLEGIAKPACYDGDTPSSKRPGIRRNATILLSNPDMLHQSILPYHAKWAGFFAQLKYVVLDEIHAYRGIFGSHVANVVRRLQRICRHYGGDPRFICCSATVANPRELAERLTSRPMRAIEQDGSPRGGKWLVLWNPPYQDAEEISRRSGNVEAQELFQALLEEDACTIVFTKARVVAELIYRYVVDGLQRRRPELAACVRPYRGGYLPNERRDIEQALFGGALRGVCSTNALELGIDVGALDAAVIVGFPGTLCSLWQQAGRAGRRQDESLVFFVAYDDPIDQYLMRNPDFVFDKPIERALIDPQNPYILAGQLGCAAFELPLEPADLADFGATAADVAGALAEDQKLRHTAERYYWAQPDFPAAQTNLRTISNATYAIVDITGGRNEVIGNVDSISAPEQVYPGAIYLHQAESYVVREYDQQARVAKVERFEADFYTQPVLSSECRLTLERMREPLTTGGQRLFGDAFVQWQTVAYRKFKFYSMELIGQTKLDLPPQRINTKAAGLQPPPSALEAVVAAGRKVIEALAGVRNLLTIALPPLAMCDRYDIGAQVHSAALAAPTIFLYDRFEGGIGYARHGYEHAEELLRLAFELVMGCGCESGCPACVGPANLRIAIHHDPDLYRAYEIPDKGATLALLGAWVGR